MADFSGLSEANVLIFKNFYVFLNLTGRIVTISVLVPHAFDHHTADIYVGVFRGKKKYSETCGCAYLRRNTATMVPMDSLNTDGRCTALA